MRMVFTYVPNGIDMRHWNPAYEGKLGELPKILKPLEPFRKDMKKFIEDLSARVAVKMAIPRAGIYFFDESSIETGTVWRSELADTLKTSQVGVTLFPHRISRATGAARNSRSS